MAGSCNQAALFRAANDKGKADAGAHLAELPAECQQEFRTVARKVGDNPVALLKLYEDVVLPGASKTLLRCGRFYLDQKAGLEGRRE